VATKVNLRHAVGLLKEAGVPDVDGSLMTPCWREVDSNHRSRKGGHRRLGRLICCSREFPRCRLFRL